MTHTRFAYIKAGWHAEIVDRSLDGFLSIVAPERVDVFDVPGAFELPLASKKLASTGDYGAVIAAALVVDGSIYRHDFVAKTVVSALCQVGLETDVPILSVCLTPHNFQNDEHHRAIFRDHFVQKGREAAQAAEAIAQFDPSNRRCALERPVLA